MSFVVVVTRLPLVDFINTVQNRGIAAAFSLGGVEDYLAPLDPKKCGGRSIGLNFVATIYNYGYHPGEAVLQTNRVFLFRATIATTYVVQNTSRARLPTI